MQFHDNPFTHVRDGLSESKFGPSGEGRSKSEVDEREWIEGISKRKESKDAFDRDKSELERIRKENAKAMRDKYPELAASLTKQVREEYILENIEALKQKIRQGRASAAEIADYAKQSKERKEKEGSSEDIKKRVERSREEKRGLASKEREREVRERGEDVLHDIQAKQKAEEDREERRNRPESAPKKEAPTSTPRKLARGVRHDTLASRANEVLRSLRNEGHLSDWRGELFNEDHPYVECMPEYGKGKRSGEVTKTKKERKENK